MDKGTEIKVSPEITKWQQIEHRKFLRLRKECESKEEPEGMTTWSKLEHKKWVRSYYRNRRNLES